MSKNKANPLPKFEGKDFPVWKAQVQAYLTAIEKLKTIQITCPRQKHTGTEKEISERNEEIASFTKDDNYVKSILILALDNTNARHILSCPTSKDIWDRLTSIYEQKSSTSRILLSKEFFTMKMLPQESIKEYVSRGEYAFNQMKDAGAKHEKDVLIDTLIQGLPNQYASFTQTWSLIDKSRQTLQELIGSLQYNESIMKTRGSQ